MQFFKNIAKNYQSVIIFVLVMILGTVMSPAFLTLKNFFDILDQCCENVLLAAGMTLILFSGGIDLSVGSILAVSGVAASMFAHPGEYHLAIPIALAVLVGLALGCANGFLVAFGGIPPFIVTLGMLTMGRGLALILSGGSPVYNISKPF